MELKQTVKTLLKDLSLKKITIADVELKYISDGLTFRNNSFDIGRLGYAFVSNKFTEYGSSFGLYVVMAINGGKLVNCLNELDLSYSNYFHANHYFGFTSLSYLSEKFFKKGTVSFFEKENISDKCELIVDKVQNLYVDKIHNFINIEIRTIDDIFEAPQNYGRPMATALLICCLNNRKDLIEDTIKRGKIGKIYDNNQHRIDEILTKLKL